MNNALRFKHKLLTIIEIGDTIAVNKYGNEPMRCAGSEATHCKACRFYNKTGNCKDTYIEQYTKWLLEEYIPTDWEKHPSLMILAEYTGELLHTGQINFDKFVSHLIMSIDDYVKNDFKMPIIKALYDYCNFASVDVALVEAYLGYRLTEESIQPLVYRAKAKYNK